MAIGEKLSKLLEMRKMRVSDLSRLTGISATTIYSIIKRDNKAISFSTIDKIAKALGVMPEYFHDSFYSDDPLLFPQGEGAPRMFAFCSDLMQSAENAPSLKADERLCLDLFRTLNPTGQQLALDTLRTFAANPSLSIAPPHGSGETAT